MNEVTVFAGFFALFGVPALVVGATMIARRIRARMWGRAVEAEVVHWETHRLPAWAKRGPRARGSHSGSTATAHVRYQHDDGTWQSAKLDQQVMRDMWVRYPAGTTMPVRIDPARPSVALVPTATSMYVFPGLLLFAGTLMTLLALGIFFGAQPPA